MRSDNSIKAGMISSRRVRMDNEWDIRIKEVEWWIAQGKGDEKLSKDEATFGEVRLAYLNMMKEQSNN